MGKGILRVVLCGFIVLFAETGQAQVRFYELGHLVGSNQDGSRALGVSPNGRLIAGASGKYPDSENERAVYWNTAEFEPDAEVHDPEPVHVLPGDVWSEATAVLDRGIVVGWSRGLSLGSLRTQGFYYKALPNPPSGRDIVKSCG